MKIIIRIAVGGSDHHSGVVQQAHVPQIQFL